MISVNNKLIEFIIIIFEENLILAPRKYITVFQSLKMSKTVGKRHTAKDNISLNNIILLLKIIIITLTLVRRA